MACSLVRDRDFELAGFRGMDREPFRSSAGIGLPEGRQPTVIDSQAAVPDCDSRVLGQHDDFAVQKVD